MPVEGARDPSQVAREVSERQVMPEKSDQGPRRRECRR